MSRTFSQIYIQAVFAVKGRSNLLQKEWRGEVFQYMAGIVEGKGQKSIIVNGMSDHVHLLFGLKPNMSVSDLVRDVKSNSIGFIKDKGFCKGFAWQDGFGSFSYCHSHLNDVYQYILNQEEHHKKRTFKQEYIAFLNKYEVPFEERFLFEWLE